MNGNQWTIERNEFWKNLDTKQQYLVAELRFFLGAELWLYINLFLNKSPLV